MAAERHDDREAEMEHRLEEVQENIDEARRKAEDDDLLFDPDEPRYHESGEVGEEQDDQTTPPA